MEVDDILGYYKLVAAEKGVAAEWNGLSSGQALLGVYDIDDRCEDGKHDDRNGHKRKIKADDGLSRPTCD